MTEKIMKQSGSGQKAWHDKDRLTNWNNENLGWKYLMTTKKMNQL